MIWVTDLAVLLREVKKSSKQLLVGLVAGQGTKCTKPRICAYAAANLVQLSKKSVIFQNGISLVLSVLVQQQHFTDRW